MWYGVMLVFVVAALVANVAATVLYVCQGFSLRRALWWISNRLYRLAGLCWKYGTYGADWW